MSWPVGQHCGALIEPCFSVSDLGLRIPASHSKGRAIKARAMEFQRPPSEPLCIAWLVRLACAQSGAGRQHDAKALLDALAELPLRDDSPAWHKQGINPVLMRALCHAVVDGRVSHPGLTAPNAMPGAVGTLCPLPRVPALRLHCQPEAVVVDSHSHCWPKHADHIPPLLPPSRT